MLLLALAFLFTSCTSISGLDKRYNTSEQDALDKFRLLVQDSLHLDYMKTDRYLIHWLTDQNLDVSRAKDKFFKSLKWRAENRIDSILSDENESLARVARVLPFEQYGFDVIGRPVILNEHSKWDYRKLALNGERKITSLYYAKVFEAGSRMAIQAGATNPDVNQFVCLTDMRGYNLRQHGCLKCNPFLLDYIRVYEENYPDTVKYFISVNAPRILDAFFQIANPLISPATRKQVLVYQSDKKEWDFIGRLIPADQLTQQFGGTRANKSGEMFP